MRPTRYPIRRLAWSGIVAGAVVVTALALPSSGARLGGLLQEYDATKGAAAEARPHAHGAGDRSGGGSSDGHGHDHNDPATKNAISRAGEVSAATQDPTTASERRANAAYVAASRGTPDPRLTTAAATYRPPARPTTRFAMANGCYVLGSGGRYVDQTADGLALTTSKPGLAEHFFFKPTDLGTYLLYGEDSDFAGGGEGVAMVAEPSRDTEWTVRRRGDGFGFQLRAGEFLASGPGRALGLGKTPTGFRLTRVDGCTRYPESQIDISGAPTAGVSPYQEVRGYVDAHTHGMAFEFLGGGVHCGRPWHEYGAPHALVDCPDHSATGGNGAALEAVLSGEPTHDPVGWPTFKDWPAPNSLTHEGTYYRWLERSWRGGQRLFVNLLVENNKLCELYPLPVTGRTPATTWTRSACRPRTCTPSRTTSTRSGVDPARASTGS